MKGLFPIIARAKFWIWLGVVVILTSLWLFFTFQQYSIQFTGGVEIVVDTPTIAPSVASAVEKALSSAWMQADSVKIGQKEAFASLVVQMKLADDAQVQQVTALLTKTLIEQQVIGAESGVLEQSVIGPSIGEYMKSSAIKAVVRGMVLMAIYILFAFAWMRQLISPALLGVITLWTMIFDIAFPAGMYGIWMSINPAIQIDAVFIIAILTVMGYSINDTIIIFDRVRENYMAKAEQYQSGALSIADLYETSLRQTMRRSLGTSFTTFIVVAAMRVFGTGSLKLFAFTLGMGVISGSFSSIFFAAPLAYMFSHVSTTQKK